MSFTSPGQLARMRATAVRRYAMTCNILSQSGQKTLNQAGGLSAAKATWQPLPGSPCKCSLWRPRDFAVQTHEGGAQQQVVRWRLSLAYGTRIATKMRVQIVGGGLYEVVGVDDDRTDAIQVLCDLKLIA